MKFPVILRVDIPALDRLLDYLEATQQKEIDALADQVRDLTARLSTTSAELGNSIEGNKTNG